MAKHMQIDMDELKIQLLEALGIRHAPITIDCSPEQQQAALSELMERGLVVHSTDNSERIFEEKKRPDAKEHRPRPLTGYYVTELADRVLGLTSAQPPAGDRNSQGGWGTSRHRWQDVVANLDRARDQLAKRPRDNLMAVMPRGESWSRG